MGGRLIGVDCISLQAGNFSIQRNQRLNSPQSSKKVSRIFAQNMKHEVHQHDRAVVAVICASP